jgi:hypothetical protein
MDIFGPLISSAFFGIFFGGFMGWGYYMIKGYEKELKENEGEKGTWKFNMLFWFIGSVFVYLIKFS